MFGFVPTPPPIKIKGAYAVLFAAYRGDMLEVKIDVSDVERIASLGRKWSIRDGVNGHQQVQASVGGRMILLHRWLLDNPDGIVDHVNRNNLDNRRVNLRVTNTSINTMNCVKPRGNGKLRGIHFDSKGTPKWVARVRANGKLMTLRTPSLDEAISFRNKVMKDLGVFVEANP